MPAETVIVGAGPYGLSATAHLRRAGVDVRVFGDPMSFWRTMPVGMMLRSNRTATSIAEWDGPLSLESYCAEIGESLVLPVPLDRFIDYGMWVQGKVAPDVDKRVVRRLETAGDGFSLELEDGERISARRVIIACGIAPFARRPQVVSGLPAELASHTSEHRDLSALSGRSVLVIGGGQSALETAALLHEAGATVEVIVRQDQIIWLRGGKYHRMLGRYSKLVYAPTDVGPMGLSKLVAAPDLFRRLPRGLQTPLAYRSIRPAGARWLVSRLAEVPLRLDRKVLSARAENGRVRVELDGGEERTVDHVLCGTGYQVDVSKYEFLSHELARGLRQVDGYPVLGPGLETSVPRLHIMGAPGAWSFGPTMRFVSGGWYAARALTRKVTGSPLPAAPAESDAVVAV